MADPLSITASIAAVIHITAVVLKSLGDLKDTPQDLRRLQTEIDSLQCVLLPALERLARPGEEKLATVQLLRAQASLEEFRMLLERLKKKLAPVAGSNRARRAVTWQFQKGEIKGILGTIERQKSILVLALQSETYTMWQETQNLCYQNHNGIAELCENVAELRRSRGASSYTAKESEGLWGPVIHYGNNYGGSNVVYGGTQIFTGATICFGKT